MDLFRLFVLNCRGLVSTPTKLDSFFPRSDLLLVTETHCRHTSSLPSPASFDRLDRPRTDPAAGGLAVYLRHRPGWRLSSWGPASAHRLWARVDGVRDAPLFVCTVYLPPSLSEAAVETFLDELTLEVERAAALGHVLLGGDFNARTGTEAELDAAVLDPLLATPRSCDPRPLALPPRCSPDTMVTPRGRLLLAFCGRLSLVIGNGRLAGNSGTEPTSRGFQGTGFSVVDYVLLPVDQLSEFSSLTVHPLEPAVSDHNALELCWPVASLPRADNAPSSIRPRFAVPRSKAATAAFAGALAWTLGASGPERDPPAPTPDLECKRLVEDVVAAIASRPARRPLPRASDPSALPYYSAELVRLNQIVRARAVRVRSLLRSSAQHPRLHAARQLLAAARRTYRSARRAAERRWKVASASAFVGLASSNPQRFWKRIFRSAPAVPQLSSDALTAYFEGILNPAVAAVDLEAAAPLDSGPVLTDTPLMTKLADPFTDDEVAMALKTLKTGRASDIFGLSAEFLRLLLPYLSSHLTPLLNRFLLEGFPSFLSTSVLIPIYKGKGALDDPANFRGISVTPILSKLYACLLERRLSAALDAARARDDAQFGFRRHRGTREAAFVLRSVTEFNTARGRCGPDGPAVYCAFIDFKQAFDSVQRPLLWRLLRTLSIPETFVRALESYYDRVEFRVESDGSLGRVASAGVGVRQGCPLSPVLFGVFIEAITRRFMQDAPADLDLPHLGLQVDSAAPFLVPPLLYADDLTLLARTAAGLQRQLDRLHSLASTFGLSVNVAKTKLFAYGSAARSLASLPSITLSGQPLEWVECFRYLGLTFDSRQGFAAAAPPLLAAAQAKYFALLRQCRAKGVDDVESLSLLFDSLVSSVLGYGAPLWAPDIFAPRFDSSNALIPADAPTAALPLAFERLQRRFMRHLLGLPRRTPHLELHLETGRPPLALQFFKQTVKFVRHLCDDTCFSPTSLVRRALAASADYAVSVDSWLRRLAAWAKAFGSEFDVGVCIPSVLSSSFSVTAASSARVTRSFISADRLRPLPSVPSALSAAFRVWAGGRSAPLTQRALPVIPSQWTRRPLSFYKSFPFRGDRALVARCRLGQPIRGLPDHFAAPSTDLRSLDPDPQFTSYLDRLLSTSGLQLGPSYLLSSVLLNPPASIVGFIRSLVCLFRLHRRVPPAMLLRRLPQLLP